LFLIKPLTLLHRYLSFLLSSFNVVLKTTGFVWARMMAKTTLYGGGEGAICIAVSNYGVDIGKQADLSEVVA